MFQCFLRNRFSWLDLNSSTMPPRNPNNYNGDDEDEDEDREDEDREPAVIREPDPDDLGGVLPDRESSPYFRRAFSTFFRRGLAFHAAPTLARSKGVGCSLDMVAGDRLA
jgi:hypothetical protein